MKRVTAIAGSLAAVVAGLALLGAGATSGAYRVDAIFDNASFLIPGQDVKIAGARVGTVKDVVLTGDRRARVEMEIDGRFAPFRSDADCTIQPQSLIGERFIQCTPGTPRGSLLRGVGGHAPTVALAGTHAPIDLDLLLATFRLPYRQRLSIIFNEFGAGLAGRGQDLNATIRRANPALQETDRVLGILDADRARLRGLLGAFEHVISQLNTRRDRVAAFISGAAGAAQATASRRSELARTVAGLPVALDQARPALVQLRTFADAAIPVLAELRQAAPSLTRLTRDVGPLSAAARPALNRLGAAAKIGTPALAATAPVAAQLRQFTVKALPTSDLLVALLDNLRARGVVEGLQSFTFNAALSTSRFDRYSHILPSHLLVGECGNYATTALPECDAHFAGGRAGAVRSGLARRPAGSASTGPRTPSQPSARPGAPAAGAIGQLLAPPASGASRPSPTAPASPQPSIPGAPAPPSVPTVKQLLNYLLR